MKMRMRELTVQQMARMSWICPGKATSSLKKSASALLLQSLKQRREEGLVLTAPDFEL